MGKKARAARNTAALLGVVIAGLYFFGYIQITNNGIFFHSRYSVPTFNGSVSYFLNYAPLIMGFAFVLMVAGLVYLYLRG